MMICPLLSSQNFTNCQTSSCWWWDEIRQCCAVLPVNFGQVVKQAAKARLDSDVELSGGAQEPTLIFKMSMDQAIDFIAQLNKDSKYDKFIDETPISMRGVDSALFGSKIKELNFEPDTVEPQKVDDHLQTWEMLPTKEEQE